MGTRSSIAIKTEDGIKAIYCHWDGYVDHNGKILKEFYNTEVSKIKSQLNELVSKVTDKAVQIKINEVSTLIQELDKTAKVTSENIVNILQYLELVEELKIAHG